MIIRKATAADAEALQQLYLHHLTQYPPEELQDIEKWRSLISQFESDKNYHLLTLELSGFERKAKTAFQIRLF